MLIDSHCHLQFRGYNEDREQVLDRCRKKGVIMNTVGTQLDTSRKAVELAEANQDIYATIGLHPIHLHATEVDEEESSFLSHEENFEEKFYDELAVNKKVIAVGECGLELYHLPESLDREKVLEKQRQIFLAHYNFAKKHNLPLVIHVRDAYNEMADLLESLGEQIIGVVHCYSGNWEQAQRFLKLGLYLGFTGVITFPARKTNPQPTLDLLEVVQNCPLDRMLVETDAPYLAPQAFRGKKCEPWMVEEVVKEIAKIRQKSVEQITQLTVENTLRLFTKIKLS